MSGGSKKNREKVIFRWGERKSYFQRKERKYYSIGGEEVVSYSEKEGRSKGRGGGVQAEITGEV